MDNSLLLLGAIGGLLPDVIRVMKNPESIKEYAGVKVISLVIQIALGVFAVWLLYSDVKVESVSPKLIAVTLGFAAPEILTRTISAIATLIGGEKQSAREFTALPEKKGLVEWWGE